MNKQISEMNTEELEKALLEVAAALGERGSSVCQAALGKLDESDETFVAKFAVQCWEFFV